VEEQLVETLNGIFLSVEGESNHCVLIIPHQIFRIVHFINQ